MRVDIISHTCPCHSGSPCSSRLKQRYLLPSRNEKKKKLKLSSALGLFYYANSRLRSVALSGLSEKGALTTLADTSLLDTFISFIYFFFLHL